MADRALISQERLKELLRYDPVSGVFFVRVARVGSTKPPGAPWGTVKDKSSHPYLIGAIDGRFYRGHRLAWLYAYGVWPKCNLDHINGNTLDNRIENLRECNQQQNNGNHHVLNANNTSGYRGVSWKNDKRKWKAYINRNDRQYHLGYFSTKEAAYEAYKAAAISHFGEFANV